MRFWNNFRGDQGNERSRGIGRGLRSSLREAHKELKGKRWVPVKRGRERQGKETTERQKMRFGTSLRYAMEAF